jgi:hypothetical protein
MSYTLESNVIPSTEANFIIEKTLSKEQLKVLAQLEKNTEQKTINMLATNSVTEENLLNLMNNVNDEFKKTTGHYMSYSEMREMMG